MADEPNVSEYERELEEALRRLSAENAELKKQIQQLLTELAHARTTSRNSSKRPSSDIVKPRRERRNSTRKIGGQPGHPMHERSPFTAEEIDQFLSYKMGCCPDCQGQLQECPGIFPNVIQQIEVIARPLVKITEHNAPWYWCKKCEKAHCAMPLEVSRAGLCGPLLTAWIAYLKGGCHASFSTIRKFLRDILGVRVARSQLAKVIAKVSAALADPWEELRTLLPLAKILNIDETGHKENRQHLYTWCYRARHYILFKIAETRSTAELLEMLGADFKGIIGCDYFSSYRCYMREFGGVLQFCLAHFIREVKFLVDFPDKATRDYGQRLLDSVRYLFEVIHQRWRWNAGEFRDRLHVARRVILRVASEQIPNCPEAQNLARRLRLHGESYFRFISTPGLDPTNNTAEQAIRFVVIDRLVTQGTRSEKGRRWCERIWTIIATCEHQGRSAFEFIRDAVAAYFGGTPAPSLRAAPT